MNFGLNAERLAVNDKANKIDKDSLMDSQVLFKQRVDESQEFWTSALTKIEKLRNFYKVIQRVNFIENALENQRLRNSKYIPNNINNITNVTSEQK